MGLSPYDGHLRDVSSRNEELPLLSLSQGSFLLR
jgi:hypothetical protein